VFQRTVQIGVERQPDRSRREAYFDVRAAETWRHADEQTPARPLPLRVETMPETRLYLVVDEGDNAPLPITKARLLLPSYRLRFFHADGTGVRLLYGRQDLQPPQYDLALLAPRVMGATAREISAAPDSGANVNSAPPSARRSVTTIFWAALSLSVLVLLGLIVKLIRGQGDAAS
jgi:hypothetical protein